MAKRTKYKNQLESKVGNLLGKEFSYESKKFPYRIPHTYLPDFVNEEKKILVESKGLWSSQDRTKHKAMKAQYPEWTIILCFYDPYRTLSKKSKTRYCDWCDKEGIIWCTTDTLMQTLSATLHKNN
jgi:hypothetical protein